MVKAASETGSAAGQVQHASTALAGQFNKLTQTVEGLLTRIRAA